jgi:hypothetical protein
LRSLSKLLASLVFCSALAACGGGGESGGIEALPTFYDDAGAAIAVWVPETRTQNANGEQVQLYLFPFSLHQRTILSSYVSRVGTSTTRNYSIAGRMTTPTVSSGSYSAKSTTTTTYLGATLFEGVSVIPADNQTRRFEITLAGTSLADEASTHTSYFDTRFGLRIGSKSSSTYKVLDPAASREYPEFVTAGEEGDVFTYKVFSNASKSTLLGTEVMSYKVLSVSAATPYSYAARVEFTIRSYSSTGLLLALQTSVDDLVYDSTSGAKSSNVSVIVDDIVGSTTSRLSFTRIK